MAPCLKCTVQGVIQGGTLMPLEERRIRLKIVVAAERGSEVEGERELAFEGTVESGSLETGTASAVGRVEGNFGIDAGVATRAKANLEAYARDGSLALLQISVQDESGHISLRADLRPLEVDDDGCVALAGTAFWGWAAEELESGS